MGHCFGFDVYYSMQVAKEFVLEIRIIKQQHETTARDSGNSDEEYFPPLKVFQISNSNSEFEWSLSEVRLSEVQR